jgi:hypothetical protein
VFAAGSSGDGKATTAIVVACISGAVAIVSAFVAKSSQKAQTRLEHDLSTEEKRREERSEAQAVLDRYRGPLLSASFSNRRSWISRRRISRHAKYCAKRNSVLDRASTSRELPADVK